MKEILKRFSDSFVFSGNLFALAKLVYSKSFNSFIDNYYFFLYTSRMKTKEKRKRNFFLSNLKFLKFLTCLIFCLGSVLLFAQYPSLENLIQIETKTKHFIVIDISGSMAPYFENVISALGIIPSAIPDTEMVSIYEFAEYPRLVVSKQAGKIGKEDFPKSAPGRYTDIWRILESILSDIKESPEDIFVIFFLTDGKDDPPPWSDRNQNRWDRIISESKQILSKKTVVVYGIGLAQITDILLLNSVFGSENVEILIRSPSTLRSAIERIIQGARRRKLRAVIMKEMDDGKIEIKERSKKEKKDRIEINYTLTSYYQHLPVQISIKEFKCKYGEGETKQKTPFDIQPKKNKEITFFLKKPTFPHWAIGRKIVKIQDKGELEVDCSFIHENEIRELGLEPKVTLVGLTQDISYNIKYGIPISFLSILFLSFILLIIFGKKWLSLPPPTLFGTILINNKPHHLIDQKKQKVYIKENGAEVMVDDKNGTEVICSLIVKREEGLEKIYLQPGENYPFFLPAGEINDDPYKLEWKGSTIMFLEMRPRLAPERKWLNFLIILILLFFLNLLIFKIGP